MSVKMLLNYASQFDSAVKKTAYYQGTSDPEKDKGDRDTATPEERKDRDTRKHVLFQNYDYTHEGADETSPGGGFYHGAMGDKKSVKDFVEKRRKENEKLDRNSQTRKNKLEDLYNITTGK